MTVHSGAESEKGLRTIVVKLSTEERAAIVGAENFGRGRWRIPQGTSIATGMQMRRKCLLRHSTDYLTRLGSAARYVILLEEQQCSG